VCISEPVSLFDALSRAINQQVPLGKAALGPIHYADRHREDDERRHRCPAFVKPPDTYREQREVRFLWIAADPDHMYVPTVLDLPELRHHFRQLR
jgi:hypothetical protein